MILSSKLSTLEVFNSSKYSFTSINDVVCMSFASLCISCAQLVLDMNREIAAVYDAHYDLPPRLLDIASLVREMGTTSLAHT